VNHFFLPLDSLDKLLTYSFSKKQITCIVLVIIGISFLCHLPVLNLDIQGKHAWRQTQTMWNIKNFTESDPNIINPRVSHFNYGDTNIYRYEFPLLQWTIGMTQRVLGSNVILVRIMLFLFGAVGAIGFFKLLQKMGVNTWSAFAGLLCYLFCPVIFYYMINPLPDNLALAAGIWYLYHIVSYQQSNENRYLFLASISLLIATLAKLPFLMFSIVSIFFFVKDLLRGQNSWPKLIAFGAIQLAVLVPALLWYHWVMPGWEGNGILKGVFDGETDWANNAKILTYHSKTMFPFLLLYPSVWLPLLVGLVFGFRISTKDISWIWSLVGITFLYLILQWDVIGTVHDYYLMPFLPWLYIFVTLGIEKLLKTRSIIWSVVALICLLSTPIVSYQMTVDKWYAVWYNKDLYTHRQVLIDAVPNDELCIMLRDMSKYVFPYQVNKRGYIYPNESLSGKTVEKLIKDKGIHYLYSDSRKFEEKVDVQPLLDSLILEAGSIHVYRLKNLKK